MENNSVNNSSMDKAVVVDSKTVTDDEESGWTAYFEDFCNNREEEDSFCSSSMVSDAASFPAKKSSSASHNYNNYVVNACNCSIIGPEPTLPNKLTLKKKRRAKEISHIDDSLEDTASSPVNSPKVGGTRVVDMNPRKANDLFNSSLGKEGSLEDYEREGRCEKNFNIGENIDQCTDELKKRGLCLVPFSMFVNYLG